MLKQMLDMHPCYIMCLLSCVAQETVTTEIRDLGLSYRVMHSHISVVLSIEQSAHKSHCGGSLIQHVGCIARVTWHCRITAGLDQPQARRYQTQTGSTFSCCTRTECLTPRMQRTAYAKATWHAFLTLLSGAMSMSALLSPG